jgi:hypothetical protein
MKLRLGFCLFVAAASLWAHHSMTAVYNDAMPVTIHGAVTKFEWANPHVWVTVDDWQVEFASRTELRRAGWTGESLHVGDMVTVAGSRARDGKRKAHGRTVTIAGGRKLSEPSVQKVAHLQTGKAAPHWPNGHVRLGPEPGEAGYWVAEAPSTRNAASDAPFQPWAKALYDYRRRTLWKDDPMAACLPAGGPRQFQDANGVQILEDPDRQRVFILARGSNRNWRNIDLDGRPVPNAADVTPSFFGYSVGKWEGDVLVIQSTGLAERFWFMDNGMPHTESAKLTERISRPDFDTLKYEVTVEDVGAYTRPWTAGWNLYWIRDDEIDEYYCDDNNQEK